jgi:NADH dehydrogenase FAD-containing subunit
MAGVFPKPRRASIVFVCQGALSVVEMGDRMVPRMMGEGAGGMIKRWVESKGVKVHTSSRVEAIQEKGNALNVRLSNGAKVDADLVICATGVTPNIGFLQQSGVACAHGVLTDEYLQTNVPGIYAAGDCAEALDLIVRSSEGVLRKGRNLCLGSLIQAVLDQTRTVGLKQANQVLVQPHWRKDCDSPMP